MNILAASKNIVFVSSTNNKIHVQTLGIAVCGIEAVRAVLLLDGSEPKGSLGAPTTGARACMITGDVGSSVMHTANAANSTSRSSLLN